MANGSDAAAGSSVQSRTNGTTRTLGNLREEEIVRLMVQELEALGYRDTARSLERESGFQLESQMARDFCAAVLNGAWESVKEMLPKLEIRANADIQSAWFLIDQQRYLELLEDGKATEALVVLRSSLMPLEKCSEDLHTLSSYMMTQTPDELRKLADWSGRGGDSRARLLDKLKGLFLFSLAVPERRLENLLQQWMDSQARDCLYHHVSADELTLYEDHECGSGRLPTKTLHVLRGHTDEVWYVAISHDGTRVASASRDEQSIVWDMATGKKLHVLAGHKSAISHVTWSPNDEKLVTCCHDASFRLWEANGTLVRSTKKHTDVVVSSAWIDDNTFATGSQDKSICVWKTTGELVWQREFERVIDLAVLRVPHELIFVCSGRNLNLVSWRDGDTSHVELPEDSSITSLSVIDGRYAAVSVSSNAIHIWDLQAKKVVSTLRGHRQPRFVIRSCFGGAEGNFVCSGSEDNKVYIWQWRKEALVSTLEGHTGTVNCVAWSTQDISLCASASDDHTVRIWGPASAASSEPA